MFVPTFKEFESLARTANLIPVYREHLADTETPVSAFSRFVEDAQAFLLESVEGGERWGRYSFIGVDPTAVFTVRDGTARLTFRDGRTHVVYRGWSPFEALRNVLAGVRPAVVPGLPPFWGGAVGYLGYETAREYEKLPSPKTPMNWPTAALMLTDKMVVFDNVRHTMKVTALARTDDFSDAESAYNDARRRIEALESRLRGSAPKDFGVGGLPAEPPVIEMASNMTREQFRDMVRRAREYIVEGDVIQTVLSQRFSAPLPATPMAVYRALRFINPSPYTFFLKFGGRFLVGSSPEVMARLTGKRIELRPIAGTRPRGASEQEDRRLADELLADEKERAEHVMLVDLGRNDLGRIAVPGSVQVRDFMAVERYSHVMHIVSHVEAILREDLDAFDVIRATFPAGTLTGAPKIRAMEIIHELEPCARGPYGGAVGYIGYGGNMDLAITIRTLEIEGQTASVQAGAGIVYDSDPDGEFDETVNKARAMVRALELAGAGLDPAALHRATHG
ncbi:MAG: anthranilate synthase component I [Kiritimatiellaeota bacterium]|nr:anthranilate synthase component I [Kiritimatiellota bacterium]